MKKNSSNKIAEVWLFNFALERENGEDIDRTIADELMEQIVIWAEEKKCQIGGGYRKPHEGEFDNEILYELD